MDNEILPGGGCRGDRVLLRELRRGDAKILEMLSEPRFGGEFNDLGPADRSRLSVPGFRLAVALIEGEEVIGTVSGRVVWHGPNRESRAWNIGIALLPWARGHGFGSDAQRALAHHLLETSPVHRVEATTDVENLAEQRALAKAGFVREGVLRGAQFRAGAWHDMVIFAMVPRDLEDGSWPGQ